jgi:hypothetical protein
MCDLSFCRADKWNPDNTGVTERLHCSLKCERMYRIAYASDATLRIEHAIKRAQDELGSKAEGIRAIELRLRVASLKRSLKQIKKAQSRSPEPVS